MATRLCRFSSLLLASALAALGACASRPASPPNRELTMPTPTQPTVTTDALALLATTSAHDYEQHCNAQLAEAKSLLAKLSAKEAGRSDAALLAEIDLFARVVDGALSTAGLLRNVHPDADVREVANRCEQAVSQVVTDINLSRPLYEAVQAIDRAPLAPVTVRLVEHMLRDFRRAGVDRPEADRQDIRRLKDELVQIGQRFDQHIREDTRSIAIPKDKLRGLPADYVAAHAADAKGRVHITTDYPDYIPFMTYAEDDSARKELYLAFRQRGAPRNEATLVELLAKRHELAQKLGYATWADYITEDKMIGSALEASRFIDKVSELSVARSHKDLMDLAATAKSLQPTGHADKLGRASGHAPAADTVQDWQKAYLEEQLRRQRYALDAQAVRAYLPFAKVRDGLLETMSELFGVAFRRVNRPAWHQDVVAYELLERGEVIGLFYLDLHPRQDKYKHAAAFPIRAGTKTAEATVLPVAALVCNFPSGDDALMEHDDVTTFFHEFGHLLHHLFAGQQAWVGQSGIATEWDFVEAPSQMLEEWSFDRETLQRFAKRKDGKVLDDDTIANMRRARALGRGLWVRQQMFYAALSLAFHRLPPGDPLLKGTDRLVADLQKKYAPFPYVQGSHFQLSFGHLEGYSAMYYTYMWSLVIAKDLFSQFQAKASLLDPTVAARYRQKVLAPGGSQDAAVLVRRFLGRDFSFDAFGQWVNAPD